MGTDACRLLRSAAHHPSSPCLAVGRQSSGGDWAPSCICEVVGAGGARGALAGLWWPWPGDCSLLLMVSPTPSRMARLVQVRTGQVSRTAKAHAQPHGLSELSLRPYAGDQSKQRGQPRLEAWVERLLSAGAWQGGAGTTGDRRHLGAW